MKFIFNITLIMALGACAKNSVSPSSESLPAPSPNALSANGTEQGNGSDNKPGDYDSAWFVGDQIIKYCYVVDRNFGVSDEQIEQDLAAAFVTWKNYIVSKKINENLSSMVLEEGQGVGINQSLRTVAGRFQVATSSQLLPTCSGEEDLKFYFGTTGEEVLRGKKQYSNPTAFSYRTSYEAKSGWGKGFVWFGETDSVTSLERHRPDDSWTKIPNWNLPFRLRGLIIHELGHVYGCEHIAGTIMEADLSHVFSPPGQTSESENSIQFELTHIDSARELFLVPFSQEKYSYDGWIRSCADCEPDLQKTTFKLITGKKPTGAIASRVSNAELHIADSAGDNTIQLDFDKTPLSTSSTGSIFQIYLELNSGPNQDSDYFSNKVGLSSNSEIYDGRIKTATGSYLDIVAERNYYAGPLVLYYLENGARELLFFPKN